MIRGGGGVFGHVGGVVGEEKLIVKKTFRR